jgi:uncharacterized protein
LITYADTSALVKLVLAERGSDLAIDIWVSSPRVVSSMLAYPEGCAALAAASRDGRLDPALYRQSVKSFDETFEQLISIEIDERLALAAGARAASFGLRGADAVHLATALDLADEEVTFLTWDKALAAAAASAGLAVAGAPV